MATLNPAKGHGYYSAKDKQFYPTNNDLYQNDDAISNTIHYVTRTGKRTDRSEDLIHWGSVGCCSMLTPDECIVQFEQIQKYVRRDREVGTKIIHEILSFSDNEAIFLLNNPQALLHLAHFTASIYFNAGFVCVYGIHLGIHYDDADPINSLNEHRLHIHFIVNSVSHITGNKFPTKLSSEVFSLNNGKTFFKIPYDTKLREKAINEELYNRIMNIDNPFDSTTEEYICNAYSLYPKNM